MARIGLLALYEAILCDSVVEVQQYLSSRTMHIVVGFIAQIAILSLG